MNRAPAKNIMRLLRYCGLFIAAAGLVALFILTRFPTTWSDEAFTLTLVRKPLFSILRLTATDVHPPLYYVLLKAFLIVTGPFLQPLTAAKLFSVLPLFLLCLLALTGVRRLYGMTAAVLFLLLLFAVPMPMAYALEIRMYSLAAFFVTGGVLTGIKRLRGDRSQKNTRALILWTLAASYTHYFACLAMAFLFLPLLLHALRPCLQKTSHTDKDTGLFRAAALSVALYLPWLIILLKQLNNLSGGYWIDPVSRYTLIGYTRFVFGSRGVLWVLFFGCAISAALLLFSKGENASGARVAEAFLCMGVMAGVLVTGVVVSRLFRPVFVDRYLLPSMPVFFLGCAILITSCGTTDTNSAERTSGRPVKLQSLLVSACTLFLLVTAVPEIRDRVVEEREVDALFQPTLVFAKELSASDAVITTNRHVNEEMALLSDARCYCTEEESALMREVFGTVDSVSTPLTETSLSTETIASVCENASRVFFLDYCVDPYPDVETVLAGSGVRYTAVEEIFIEGPVVVYELSAPAE